MIGMECAIMKWDTNRVQKAEKREKSEFELIVNPRLKIRSRNFSDD
jgi:hypothetical protein